MAATDWSEPSETTADWIPNPNYNPNTAYNDSSDTYNDSLEYYNGYNPATQDPNGDLAAQASWSSVSDASGTDWSTP